MSLKQSDIEDRINHTNKQIKFLENRAKSQTELEEFDTLVTKLSELNDEYREILRLENNDDEQAALEKQKIIIFDPEYEQDLMETKA